MFILSECVSWRWQLQNIHIQSVQDPLRSTKRSLLASRRPIFKGSRIRSWRRSSEPASGYEKKTGRPSESFYPWSSSWKKRESGSSMWMKRKPWYGIREIRVSNCGSGSSDPKKRMDKHKENEAVEFTFTIDKDDPQEVALALVSPTHPYILMLPARGSDLTPCPFYSVYGRIFNARRCLNDGKFD